MQIEIRNLKHMPSLSEETNCYTADVYVDGAKTFSVSNRGHGGSTDFHPYGARFNEVNAWVKANVAPIMDYGDPLEVDLELHVDLLVEEAIALKEMRRLMKKKVLIADGAEVKTLSVKGMTVEQVLAHPGLPKQVKGGVVLNTLPEAEALKRFRGK